MMIPIILYRRGDLTQSELFAWLTGVVSTNPTKLAEARSKLAFDPNLRREFETWLQGILHEQPRILVVGTHPREIEISKALLEVLAQEEREATKGEPDFLGTEMDGNHDDEPHPDWDDDD
jgi:hypothetical protein